MIPVETYRNERVAVFGLARSGVAAAHALRAGGADVLVWDDDAEKRSALADFAVVEPAAIRWDDVAALVLSPGIPLTHPEPHPVVTGARTAGVPVIGDIELFGQATRKAGAAIVAITGTNGKSTTTALVNHMLRACGRDSVGGGNIGVPALALDPQPAGGTYVLELSSYQIDLLDTFRADVAVLLNISPDHLDRHGGLANYVAVKRRIFARQGDGQTAIVGVDDRHCRAIHDELITLGSQRVIPVSATTVAAGGVYVRDGWLIDDMAAAGTAVGDLRRLERMPGQHNWQNVAAAYAVGRALGLDAALLFAAIAEFPGLAHRMEIVRTLRGVRYVNDSKATNVDATARALMTFDNIYWIVGGRPKEGGIAALEPCFSRVERAYLIGEAAGQFAQTLHDAVDYEIVGDLATAVLHAGEQAPEGAVVLLSPAAASFDQFADFEARGAAFRKAVEALS